jgi:ABC-2 type transport system permease protein
MNITWNFIKSYTKLHIKTAMEYKLNFIIQVIFMIINDFAFALFWIILFSKITEINGWIVNDFLALFALGAVCFGIPGFFLGNWRDLNDIIAEGKLDFYLTLPKNELIHTLISKSTFNAFGDIVFGVILFFLVVPITLVNILLFILFSITGAIMFTSLMVIISTFSFWFGRNSGTHEAFFNLALSMNSYPSILYGSTIKTIFFFIIPIFFINNASIFVIKEFSLFWITGIFVMTILLPVIAFLFFKIGLKKYESGNLVTARV